MTLFDECLQALRTYRVLSTEESMQIVDSFEEEFPVTSWARVDWEKHLDKIPIKSSEDIIPVIQQRFHSGEQPILTYIIWDNMSYPVVECTLEDTLRAIDDVTAVSFDTWMYSPSPKFVVEFYHEGEVTIGFGGGSSQSAN